MSIGDWLGSWLGKWLGAGAPADPGAITGTATMRLTASGTVTWTQTLPEPELRVGADDRSQMAAEDEAFQIAIALIVSGALEFEA